MFLVCKIFGHSHCVGNNQVGSWTDQVLHVVNSCATCNVRYFRDVILAGTHLTLLEMYSQFILMNDVS